MLRQALQLAVTRRMFVEQYWKWRIIVKRFTALQVYISGCSVMLSSQSYARRLYKSNIRNFPRVQKNYDISTRTVFPERWTIGAGRLSSALVLYSCSFLRISHTTHRTFGKTFKLRDNVKFWSCCPVRKPPFLARTPYWTSAGHRCAEITYV